MMMRFALFIFAALSFSASLFAGFSPSEWDFYCRKCHIERPVNSLYDPSIKAHSRESLSCVACHPDRGIAGHISKAAENFRLMFRDLTLPPDVRYQAPSSATSDECLLCHFYILEVDEIEQRKLPKDVRRIKLRAAHSQHWDYRTQTAAQRAELNKLTTGKAKASLARAEQDRLDRLSLIEIMQCSRCHERFKKDSPGGIDPNVNIAMKNPMECTSCHIALRNSIHPGNASPLPSAVSCEWCHHGNLHQKMTFFAVDRGTASDCLSCHPGYTDEKLAAVKPGQFIHKSTGAAISESGENKKIKHPE